MDGWNIIIREDFMNRWIILHLETYIYGRRGNQENTRNNKAKFNRQNTF